MSVIFSPSRLQISWTGLGQCFLLLLLLPKESWTIWLIPLDCLHIWLLEQILTLCVYRGLLFRSACCLHFCYFGHLLAKLLCESKTDLGFPGGASGKESTTQCRGHKIPGSRRSPRVENGNPHLLAWKILWKEEPGRLQSMGSQRVRHHWVTKREHTQTHTYTNTQQI